MPHRSRREAGVYNDLSIYGSLPSQGKHSDGYRTEIACPQCYSVAVGPRYALQPVPDGTGLHAILAIVRVRYFGNTFSRELNEDFSTGKACSPPYARGR